MTDSTELQTVVAERLPSVRRAASTLVEWEKIGTWNNAKMADYLVEKGNVKWTEVSTIARLVYGRSFKEAQRKVRVNLCSLYREMMARGLFAVVESAKNGKVERIKLANLDLAVDRECVNLKLGKMRDRRDCTEEEYTQACAILASHFLEAP